MVMESKNLCCKLQLRTGCFIYGGLEVFFQTLVSIGLVVLLAIPFPEDMIREALNNENDPEVREHIQEVLDIVRPIYYAALGILLLINLTSVIMGSLFIHGARTNNSCMIFTWQVWSMFKVVMLGISVLGTLVSLQVVSILVNALLFAYYLHSFFVAQAMNKEIKQTTYTNMHSQAYVMKA